MDCSFSVAARVMVAAILVALASVHCGADDGAGAGASSGSSGGGASSGSTGGASSGGASSSSSSSSSGASSSGGASSGGGVGGDGGSSSGGAPDLDTVIPADRHTVWQPGIPGGIPARTTVCATLNASTFGGADASGAIQAAIDKCPEGQVVQLGAGTFTIASTLMLTKGVVLRGAGSTAGGHPGTTLHRSPAGVVVQIGHVNSTSNADLGAGIDVTADALKGATTISVASAAGFKAGDIVQIDAVDDPAMVLNTPPYDCPYFKRAADRSIGQRVEIASVTGTTLTLTSRLHWSFTKALKAQVAPVQVPITRYAGLEGVLLNGGSHPYDGGGVNVWNAAYSWVKDVETDTITGMHIVLSGTYRFVVRDSYVHHSGNYGFGTGCYGIVVRFQSADSLVENNIARYLDKPILFNASGGGNVIAYNYVDDSWATPLTWQEVNIDCHCTFPHMELIEGNFAPHVGVSATHGNAGYLTFFRNYSSSQFRAIKNQTGNVTAIEFDTSSQGMNVVGSVLGAPGIGAAYEESANDGQCGSPHVFLLGSGYGVSGCSWSATPASDPALTSLLRHGNFDYVSNTTKWSGDTSLSHTIPASAYLTEKPAFWPNGAPWPWTGPDVTPMVGLLPARDRFDKNFVSQTP